jgi:lysozyme family protein
VSADFLRALAFVLKWEGGWSDRVDDPGGATMHGITLATYTAWRAAHGYAAPSKAALREITDEEVEAIYYRQYWQAAGCEMLEWPLSLAQFDAAVNTGVGQANKFLEATHNFDGYMAARIDWYTRLKTWPTFSAGWMRRCADLLKEAAG